MEWSHAIVALTFLAVAALSSRLSGTPVTPAMCSSASGCSRGHADWYDRQAPRRLAAAAGERPAASQRPRGPGPTAGGITAAGPPEPARAA